MRLITSLKSGIPDEGSGCSGTSAGSCQPQLHPSASISASQIRIQVEMAQGFSLSQPLLILKINLLRLRKMCKVSQP
jgi:hypothetical protein